MKLKEFLLVKTFPGTLEEYQYTKDIHKTEIKKYRIRKQYILGGLLFFGSLIYLLMISHSWIVRGLLVAMMLGEILIRDTITEHYCLKIYREYGLTLEEMKHQRSSQTRLSLSRILLLVTGYAICLGLVGVIIQSLFHLTETSGVGGGIVGGGAVLGIVIFNYLADQGKMKWFFKDTQ